MRTFRIYCLATFLLLLAANSALAILPDSAQILSEYHAELGKRWLEKNQQRQAVNELFQALTINPGHASARAQLQGISMASEDFKEIDRLSREYFLELVDYVAFVLTRIETLNNENQRIIDNLQTYILPEERSASRAKDFHSQLEALLNDAKGILKGNDLGDDLASLESALTERKIALVALLERVQILNTQLHQEKSRLITASVNVPQYDRIKHLGNKLKDVQMTLIRKEQIIEQQTKNIALLRDELGLVRMEFASLQQRFSDTETKIDSLTNDLAGATLEIYQHDQSLTKKEAQVNNLQTELGELRERSELMQRLIQEKELSRLAAIENKTQDQTAQELQEQLAALNQDFDKVSLRLAARENELAKLNQELARRDEIIAQLKHAFALNEQRVDELLGVVDIYQNKLGETLRSIDGFDHQREFFESQLDGAKLRSLPSEQLAAGLFDR